MTRTRVILIVDDDPDVRDLLTSQFTRAGYEVRAAADGAEAIEALTNAEPPSAIVTDLHMPGLVGQELLEYVQSDERLHGVPVAVVSAHPQLAPAGVQVFPKPTRFSRILDYVRGALRARQ